MSACAKCGKRFGLLSISFDSETVYKMAFGYKLSLNDRWPSNPYKKKSLCDNCYHEVFENAPALPRLSEYWVDRLITSEDTISGKLFSVGDKVVFETYGEHEGRLEIQVAKVKDVRFATEKDISALRVWLVGPVLGVFWKKKHNILLIDFEDEFGIIQHLAFEGQNDIENAEKELYNMRKAEKLKGE